jgi:alkyl hydroperoxide reductase subunit F
MHTNDMEIYDLIIIGGGPAGSAAGVYASRKQLHTLLITPEWGGQSIVSPAIQNWIGSPTISGNQLANDLKAHVETYAGEHVTIASGRRVTALSTNDDGTHTVTLDNDETATARAVLIASGSQRRRLDVPGADTFEHKGVTYCASCDGPIFAGQDVAVIGGGNAGFETAAQLLAYAKSVTLLHHNEQYKADPITVERVLAHENMTGLTNVKTTAVEGAQMVTGLTYTDTTTGESHTLPVAGVFVEIGMIPTTDFAKEAVALDNVGRVTIDPWTQKTNTPGIWAAGDCTNVRYHQNNISAGDAVRALEDIYVTLKTT